MLTGGCFCGALRYEAHGTPFHVTLCHCDDCRRVAGAPAVGWFSVARADYRVVTGSPTRFASSAHAERSFCPHCGTPLTFQAHESPDELDVTLGSLDRPGDLAPIDHTHADSRVAWWDRLASLTQHPHGRPPGT